MHYNLVWGCLFGTDSYYDKNYSELPYQFSAEV